MFRLIAEIKSVKGYLMAGGIGNLHQIVYAFGVNAGDDRKGIRLILCDKQDIQHGISFCFRIPGSSKLFGGNKILHILYRYLQKIF